MTKLHNSIHWFAKQFLPDLHHLPTHNGAKNALFFLGLFGFGTMLFSEVSANVNISTSLNNNVMTIEKLRVTTDGQVNSPWKVELGTNGIRLDLGTPVGVLKRNTNWYITQGNVGGSDIDNNAISTNHIQNGAIWSGQIASGSISTSQIQDGAITCDKINIPWFTCSGVQAPNSACPTGQFLQWLSATGGAICSILTWWWVLPPCEEWEIPMMVEWQWACTPIIGGTEWDQLWTKQSFLSPNIYNKNRETGKVWVGLKNPQSTLHVKGTFLVEWQGNFQECTLASTKIPCQTWYSCYQQDPNNGTIGICVPTSSMPTSNWWPVLELWKSISLEEPTYAQAACGPAADPNATNSPAEDLWSLCSVWDVVQQIDENGNTVYVQGNNPWTWECRSGMTMVSCSAWAWTSSQVVYALHKIWLNEWGLYWYDTAKPCSCDKWDSSECYEWSLTWNSTPSYEDPGTSPNFYKDYPSVEAPLLWWGRGWSTLINNQRETRVFESGKMDPYHNAADVGEYCYDIVRKPLEGGSINGDGRDGTEFWIYKKMAVSNQNNACVNLETTSTLATIDPNAILYVGQSAVGILTKDPQYALDVVGTVRASQVLTLSDARLKTDIKPIDGALKKLMGIQGYIYTLKVDGSTQYGVLAQQVEELFPYAVTTAENGLKSVNYNSLIAPMIQSIHELDTKVQNLEKTYQSNENRIKALENKLAK